MTIAAEDAINDFFKEANGITEAGPAPGGVPGHILVFNELVAWGILIQTPDKKIDVTSPLLTEEANSYLVDNLREVFSLDSNYGHLTSDSEYSAVQRVVSLPIKKVMQFREGATQILLQTGAFFTNKQGLVDIHPQMIGQSLDSTTGPVEA